MRAYFKDKKVLKKAEKWYQNDVTKEVWVLVDILGKHANREYNGDGEWGDYYTEYLIKLPNGEIKETNSLYLK